MSAVTLAKKLYTQKKQLNTFPPFATDNVRFETPLLQASPVLMIRTTARNASANKHIRTIETGRRTANFLKHAASKGTKVTDSGY